MNLLGLFLKGGLVMWPILICSLVAVAVIIEKIIVIRRANIDHRPLMMKVRSALSRNDITNAVEACSSVHAPIGGILKRAILNLENGTAAVREGIESAANEEIFLLEKHLGLLANVAAISPMLGFLGTVVGMVLAFQSIEQLGGNADASALAGGIWQGLLCSAYGLIVGIPALFFYNIFVGSITRLVHNLEMTTEEFFMLLKVSDTDHEAPVAPSKPKKPVRTMFADDEFFEPKNDD